MSMCEEEVDGQSATTVVAATAAAAVVTTYSPANNSYTTTRPVQAGSCLWSEEDDDYDSNRKIRRPTRRRSTMSETLLATLVNGGQANCLLACLLGTSLVASILNTLLLAFVVKSIQLNDSGPINGKVTWDERIGSTLLELPTRLAGKSISLHSIESLDDKPLRLEKWSPLSAGQQDGSDDDDDDEKADKRVAPASGFGSRQGGDRPNGQLLLFAGHVGSDAGNEWRTNMAARHSPKPTSAAAAGGASFESNYMAVNLNRALPPEQRGVGWSAAARALIDDNGSNGGDDDDHDDDNDDQRAAHLEIGAKRLLLNLLPTTASAPATEAAAGAGRRLLEFDDDYHHYHHYGRNDDGGLEAAKQLDGGRRTRRQSITLPLEGRLQLGSPASGSLVVNELLESPEITGSMEENLSIQTRDGKLACVSTEAMKLVSRSADVQLVAHDRLVLSAASLSLTGRQLYLAANGLRYFDSDAAVVQAANDGPRMAADNNDDDANSNVGANLASDEADEERHETGLFRSGDSSGGRGTGALQASPLPPLEAYNLVVLNGLLMSAA